MANKYLTVGKILKSKDKGSADYIRMEMDVVLKKGDYLNLENKASRLKSLDTNVENGKLSEETANKIRENVEKTPWYNPKEDTGFVRFEIVKVSKD